MRRNQVSAPVITVQNNKIYKHKKSRKAAWILLAAAPAAIAMMPHAAVAGTDTWTGTGDGEWTTATEWTGLTAATPITGDSLVFGGTVGLTSDNNVPGGHAFVGRRHHL